MKLVETEETSLTHQNQTQTILKMNAVYFKYKEPCPTTSDENMVHYRAEININRDSYLKYNSTADFRNRVLRSKKVLVFLLTIKVKSTGIQEKFQLNLFYSGFTTMFIPSLSML